MECCLQGCSFSAQTLHLSLIDNTIFRYYTDSFYKLFILKGVFLCFYSAANSDFCGFRKRNQGSRKIAQWLRVSTTPAEDLRSVPSSHRVTPDVC